MSTDSECEIFEFQPHQWYLLLEYHSGENRHWHEDAYCDGPFPSSDLANAFLHGAYANTGAEADVLPYDPTFSQKTLLVAAVDRSSAVSPEAMNQAKSWLAEHESADRDVVQRRPGGRPRSR